jgi:formylglycine-generating enzyme required for sulfatase activity
MVALELFTSYARADQRTCEMLVKYLASHHVWYDQRLLAGDDWWKKIIDEINRCHVFLFLVSADSLKSYYCNLELEHAKNTGKHIIPIKIEKCNVTDNTLNSLQMIDMSGGMTGDCISKLLNALTAFERSMTVYRGANATPATNSRFEFDLGRFEILAVQAFQREDYDTTVFILEEAKRQGMLLNVAIKRMLLDAKKKLEQKDYKKHMQSRYSLIVEMVKHDSTLAFARAEFKAFRQKYPNYDPSNLSILFPNFSLPDVEWCVIPEGNVMMDVNGKLTLVLVEAFKMSKHLITNAQYQLFVDAEDGYSNPKWWDFSAEAKKWRKYHTKPKAPLNQMSDHPRANVTWYEAVAYCLWSRETTGLKISLPNEQQWMRAARADSLNSYTWGKDFSITHVNCQEAKIGTTSHVGRFVTGKSPFEVMDMLGNLWEWSKTRGSGSKTTISEERILKGGCYASPKTKVNVSGKLSMGQHSDAPTIGFRVIIELK